MDPFQFFPSDAQLEQCDEWFGQQCYADCERVHLRLHVGKNVYVHCDVVSKLYVRRPGEDLGRKLDESGYVTSGYAFEPYKPKKPLTLYKHLDKHHRDLHRKLSWGEGHGLLTRFKPGNEEEFAAKLSAKRVDQVEVQNVLAILPEYANYFKRFKQEDYHKYCSRVRKSSVKLYSAAIATFEHKFVTRLFDRDYSNIYHALAHDAVNMKAEEAGYQVRFTTGKGGQLQHDGQDVFVPKMRFYLEQQSDDPYVSVVLFDQRVGGWHKISDVKLHKSGKVYVT